MSGAIDTLSTKRVLMLASNPAVSPVTGRPLGFWWAELTHPYWEFVERGYSVEIASPDGGALQWDSWSDPRDASGYSAHDLISLGFINSPMHFALTQNTKRLAEIDLADYDAIFLVGGRAPMVTFYNDPRVLQFVAAAYDAGKVVASVCHATCVLLKTTLADGTQLVDGKTWTGFANSEEQFADNFVSKRIQPFWTKEEAKKLAGTNFIVNSMFKAHALRDGRLITGQQQYSGAATRLVIEALGV